MKAFEKWRNEQEGSRSGRSYKADARVWREALNWARKRILENLKITSYDDNIACVKSIQMDIEIELDICQKVEYGDGNGYRKVCTDCPAKMECRDALDKVQNETKTG